VIYNGGELIKYGLKIGIICILCLIVLTWLWVSFGGKDKNKMWIKLWINDFIKWITFKLLKSAFDLVDKLTGL